MRLIANGFSPDFGTVSAAFGRFLAMLLALALLVGCAAGPGGNLKQSGELQYAQVDPEEDEDFDIAFEEDPIYDPLEPVNRFTFEFNRYLDGLLIKPLAIMYRTFLPDVVLDGIHNALRNLRSPVIFANDLFQGSMDRAGNTLARFLINSTIGVAGLIDVAEKQGYPYHSEDFGQTLGWYGTGEGFYLVLPILGPSNARDGAGTIVDIFLDPLTYIAEAHDANEWLWVRRGLEGLDFRSRNIETLDELERDSLDFYARIRSLYHQQRINEINNGMTNNDDLGPAQISQVSYEDPYDPHITIHD